MSDIYGSLLPTECRSIQRHIAKVVKRTNFIANIGTPVFFSISVIAIRN